MAYSMTAFARDETSDNAGTFIWELRSVNHRYLELNLRLPEQLRQIEPQVRKLLQSSLKRGKVDCGLKYQPPQTEAATLAVNNEVITSLLATIEQIQPQLPDNQRGVTALDILGWPGAVNPPAAPDGDALTKSAITALKTSLDQLKQTRAKEGEQLSGLISQRLDSIDEIVAKIRVRVPEIISSRRDKLRTRVEELVSKTDPDRLEQELVILAQKADVEEELDRLEIHLREVHDTLARDEPIGRRLDFLMQELNREANTTASKSIDGEMTALTVDLKVLIEQMREQIQNIE